MAEWIKTSGERITVTPKSGKKKFKLEELQEYVGGFIELVRLPGRYNHMVVNEEGKIHGLPFNEVATAIIASVSDQLLAGTGMIVGDVLIVGPGEM